MSKCPRQRRRHVRQNKSTQLTHHPLPHFRPISFPFLWQPSYGMWKQCDFDNIYQRSISNENLVSIGSMSNYCIVFFDNFSLSILVFDYLIWLRTCTISICLPLIEWSKQEVILSHIRNCIEHIAKVETNYCSGNHERLLNLRNDPIYSLDE